MKIIKLLPLLLLVACYNQGIVFMPDFYLHDSETQSMTNEEGKEVLCSDDAFNEYASMHKDKIKELAEILKRARLPNNMEKNKGALIQYLENVYQKSNENKAPVF